MAIVLSILGAVVGIASFVLFIMVLIKQFQNAGALMGIIGIITCGIWTFIWGWMNSNLVGRNVMIAWSACIVLGLILNGSASAFQ